MALFTTPGASLGGVPGSTALARLLVVISGNTQGLNAALGSAAGSLSGFQSNAGALGNTLTRSVTLPILAIGGAATKMAIDFQAAMARVAGLTSIPIDRIEEFQDKILELSASEEIIAGPTELADALYYAGSAGLTASQAMQVVEQSAKAASVGMGDASDVARVLISAMNAFGSDGLTAAKAVDALTAAVKLGTAEPNEMAIALGRLLPIAEKAGLTFESTVAQVAALTNLGVPTRVATTSLRALFGQFLAPTQKADENLKALGISYQELTDTLTTGGAVQAFHLIDRATEGNAESIKAIIPQIRALTAYYGLSEDRLDETAGIIEEVTNSTGYLDRALQKFIPTAQFKFANAVNELQVAAIEAGAVLIPIFNGMVSIIGDFGEAIQNLPAVATKAIVGFLALAAAAGPVLKIWASLNTANGVFVGGMAQVAKAMTLTAVAAALAVGSFASFARGTGGIVQLITGSIASFAAFASLLGVVRNAMNALPLATTKAGLLSIQYVLGTLSGAALSGIAAGLTLVALAVVYFIRKAGEAERNTEALAAGFSDGAIAGYTFAQSLHNLEGVSDETKERLRELGREAGILKEVLNESTFETALGEAGQGIVAAIDDITRKVPRLNDQFGEQIAIIRRAAAEGENWGDALRAAGFDAEAVLQAIGKQVDIFADFPDAQDLVGNLDAAIQAYNGLAQANVDYQNEAEASIIASAANSQAIEQLADKYGVSTDFISQKLAEFGVSATQVQGQNESLWAKEALGLDDITGARVGATAEAKEADAELIASRQESLRSAIDFFGGIEDITKASSDKIVAQVQKITDAQVNFATNVGKLRTRGVGSDALQFLVDQGPQAVAAFVKLSGDELNKWENNFAIAMAAGDAVVLNEGKHLQGKGDAMISGFVESILSNKELGAVAGRQVVQAVQQGLNSGDLHKNALNNIRKFAEGIVASKNIPANKAVQVINTLVQRLSDNPKFIRAGNSTARMWAAGIAQKLDLPKKAATDIANAFINQVRAREPEVAGVAQRTAHEYSTGVSSGEGEAKQAGQDLFTAAREGTAGQTLYPTGSALGHSLATGIASAGPAAAAAARGLVSDARNAAEQAARNSPKYFTYYMGQRFVDNLAAGIASRSAPVIARPTVMDPATIRGGRGIASTGPLEVVIVGGSDRLGRGDKMVILEGRLDPVSGKVRALAREEIGEGHKHDQRKSRMNR